MYIFSLYETILSFQETFLFREEKLDIQHFQLKSGSLFEKKKELGDVNFEIASAEAESAQNEANTQKMKRLKSKSE